jgi:hypothetical protein
MFFHSQITQGNLCGRRFGRRRRIKERLKVRKGWW